MFMLTFVLIDGCEYFWFSLSRVRVGWFFDNQFKNFYLKLIVSAITSLSRII